MIVVYDAFLGVLDVVFPPKIEYTEPNYTADREYLSELNLGTK